MLLDQQARQGGIAERGIGRLVDDGSRRNELVQRRHKFEGSRWEVLAGGLMPAAKIILPLAATIFRILRRDEAREDRSGLVVRNDRDDRRQDTLHPRRRPQTAGSEDVLHVD